MDLAKKTQVSIFMDLFFLGGGSNFENAYVIDREGVPKCLHLLTWGEGGVKNSPKHAYVICGRPQSQNSKLQKLKVPKMKKSDENADAVLMECCSADAMLMQC